MTETNTMPIAEPVIFTYKCRVECPIDFGKFYSKSLCYNNGYDNRVRSEITNIKGERVNQVGSTLFTFSSGLELDELLKWEKDYESVPDCHVLFQTLELIENYTGERKYDRI